jgi:hypothetical protein
MKITNINNLPAPLVAAVSKQREPSLNSISVTTLINPPQIRLLTLKYWSEIEEDASDRLWATMGSLMHTLLDQHAGIDGHQSERTLETMVEGVKVVGTFDLFREDGLISDYKFVSVWTTMNGIKPEWVSQLNLYAELLRRAGEKVEALQIVAIYRDWSKNKANDYNYPQSQVQIFSVPLWQQELAASFLEERVRFHVAAQNGESSECSPEERWERPHKYALMKEGRKSAVKLYDNKQEALAAISGKDHYVQMRLGAQVRCESYCAVSAFCPQFARIREIEQVSTLADVQRAPLSS